MRLFVCGDVHRTHDDDKMFRFKRQMKDELTIDDYLVVCGDFGIVWDGFEKDKRFIKYEYGDFPCTILWVDGNHENFDLLKEYKEEYWNGGKVHRISDNIIHLMRGEIFSIENLKILAMGGARSTDRGYDTRRMAYWWPEELPSALERQNAWDNLERHNYEVDYIFTHDAPEKVLTDEFIYIRLSDPEFKQFLGEISEKVQFKHWYFGHHHDDRTEGKYTCLYNTIVEVDV